MALVDHHHNNSKNQNNNDVNSSTINTSNNKIANDEEYAGPEPTKFNPDRFSEEAVAARKGTRAEFLDHPVACTPFGFGARMCVGSRVARLEVSALISRIVQDHQLEYDAVNSGPTFRLSHTITKEYPCPIIHATPL